MQPLQHHPRLLTILVFLALAVTAGCSRPRRGAELRAFGLVGNISAQPPQFLVGASSALLTNSAGYSAHVEAQGEAMGSAGTRKFSGELFCRQGVLLLATEEAQRTGKGSRPGGFSYLWNVAAGTGFVLSESLQAYAPIQVPTRISNVVIQADSAPLQRISGYACRLESGAVWLSDGSTAQFQLFRAPDLQNLAIRLVSSSNSIPLDLTLSRVRLVAPPTDLFAPPAGFSKYATPEAMADEIAARQRNLMRPARGEETPYRPPPAQ